MQATVNFNSNQNTVVKPSLSADMSFQPSQPAIADPANVLDSPKVLDPRSNVEPQSLTDPTCAVDPPAAANPASPILKLETMTNFNHRRHGHITVNFYGYEWIVKNARSCRAPSSRRQRLRMSCRTSGAFGSTRTASALRTRKLLGRSLYYGKTSPDDLERRADVLRHLQSDNNRQPA